MTTPRRKTHRSAADAVYGTGMTTPVDIAKVPIATVGDVAAPTPAVARERDVAPLRSWAEMRSQEIDKPA
jgi:hypothetical protein